MTSQWISIYLSDLILAIVFRLHAKHSQSVFSNIGLRSFNKFLNMSIKLQLKYNQVNQKKVD